MAGSGAARQKNVNPQFIGNVYRSSGLRHERRFSRASNEKLVGYSYRGNMPTTLASAAVEYVATTRIGEKGQFTVPKQFREELGLGAGAPFAVLRFGDGLILLPE